MGWRPLLRQGDLLFADPLFADRAWGSSCLVRRFVARIGVSRAG
jgi:hypothetical protein